MKEVALLIILQILSTQFFHTFICTVIFYRTLILNKVQKILTKISAFSLNQSKYSIICIIVINIIN